jgi:hypothetical protein
VLWWKVAMGTALVLGYGIVAAIAIYYLRKPLSRGRSREEITKGRGPGLG